MKISQRIDYENLILLNQVLFELASIGISLEATAENLYGRSREAHFVFGRAIVALYLRRKGMALTRIGEYLGGREHGTIISLLKYKRGRQAFDKRFHLYREKIERSANEFTSYDSLIDYHYKEIEKLKKLKRKMGRENN